MQRCLFAARIDAVTRPSAGHQAIHALQNVDRVSIVRGRKVVPFTSREMAMILFVAVETGRRNSYRESIALMDRYPEIVDWLEDGFDDPHDVSVSWWRGPIRHTLTVPADVFEELLDPAAIAVAEAAE
jgi:hypothetical protein